MINQVILVGRLVEKPICEESENGRKVAEITLAVPRSFKNDEGVYETDFIKATLWQQVAESTSQYCNEGDIIGVKGRLQRLEGNQLQLVAEKITFLSSSRKGK